MFLLWLYLLWIIVLVGVEIAYVTQNYGSLLRAEREQWERARVPLRTPSVDLALEAAICIARHFRTGRGPLAKHDLAKELETSLRDLSPVVAVLERTGIVVKTEAGWLLARPPEDIPLAQIIEAWRAMTTVRRGRRALTDAVDEALTSQLTGSLADALDRWPDEDDAEGAPKGPELVSKREEPAPGDAGSEPLGEAKTSA